MCGLELNLIFNKTAETYNNLGNLIKDWVLDNIGTY